MWKSPLNSLDYASLQDRINPWSAGLEHLVVSVDIEVMKRKIILLAFSMDTTNEAIWGCSGYILIVEPRLRIGFLDR